MKFSVLCLSPPLDYEPLEGRIMYNGVELLHLNNVSTGCILLGGLFIYDVFWVSWAGTQRMSGYWAPSPPPPLSLAQAAVV